MVQILSKLVCNEFQDPTEGVEFKHNLKGSTWRSLSFAQCAYLFVFLRSSDDILKAISKLRVLGSGFTTVTLLDGDKNSDQLLVRSVPGELSADHAAVLRTAEGKSHATVSELK